MTSKQKKLTESTQNTNYIDPHIFYQNVCNKTQIVLAICGKGSK